MQTLKFKRGDTWTVTADALASGQPVDLVPVTIASQIRSTPDGSIVATWTVTKSPTVTGRYTMTIAAATTAAVAGGAYLCDVQYTDGAGAVASTSTFAVEVEPDITRP